MPLEPLEVTSLAARAADAIREAIRDGRYQPGTRLVERRLAEELGISHIPIREALARLSEEGLVERLPRRGARVAGLSLRELEELTSLRILLEQFVAVRVQERLTPKVDVELRRLLKPMVEAAAHQDVKRVFEADREFHARLWALAEHSILADVLTHLRGRLDAFLRDATIRRPLAEMQVHAQAHIDLLDAIASGNPERASRQVAAHVQDAHDRLRELYLASDPGRMAAGEANGVRRARTSSG